MSKRANNLQESNYPLVSVQRFPVSEMRSEHSPG